jgi:hypothetical protein
MGSPTHKLQAALKIACQIGNAREVCSRCQRQSVLIRWSLIEAGEGHMIMSPQLLLQAQSGYEVLGL